MKIFSIYALDQVILNIDTKISQATRNHRAYFKTKDDVLDVIKQLKASEKWDMTINDGRIYNYYKMKPQYTSKPLETLEIDITIQYHKEYFENLVSALDTLFIDNDINDILKPYKDEIVGSEGIVVAMIPPNEEVKDYIMGMVTSLMVNSKLSVLNDVLSVKNELDNNQMNYLYFAPNESEFLFKVGK